MVELYIRIHLISALFSLAYSMMLYRHGLLKNDHPGTSDKQFPTTIMIMSLIFGPVVFARASIAAFKSFVRGV